MGLFDKITGRERPDDTTAVLPPDGVAQALIGAAGPQDAWMLVPANEPGVDLVTEWRVQEPQFAEFFGTVRDRSHLIVLQLQLDQDEREVRVLERSVSVTQQQGAFGLSWEKQASTGIVAEKTFDKTVGGNSTTTFDDNWLKEPLKRAALASGWGWHPVTKL